MKTTKLNAIDLYCGAGGTTTGAHMSGCVDVRIAVNHWKPAIYTHQDNHPDTRHIHAPIDHVNPRDFRDDGINLILASPECTHHSRARGGKPVNEQKRAGGWDVIKWVEVLRPSWVVVENVREWLDWGPVDDDGQPLKSKVGEFFKAWVAALQAANYRVEWKLLNAADYGEATSRTRLFVIARKGNRAIPWPKPTHTRDQWRPASDIIDWHLPCPSVFTRKHPLKAKTMDRLRIGIERFCKPERVEPFLAKLRGNSNVASIAHPVPTLTAGGGHVAFVRPFLIKYHGGADPKRNGTERSRDIDEPLPTLDTQNRLAMAAPFIVQMAHRGREHRIEQPMPTITTKDAKGVAVPFLLSSASGGAPRPAGEPVPTMVCRGRPQLALPFMVPNFGERNGQTPRTHSLDDPLPTVTSHGAGQVAIPFLFDTNHGGHDHRTHSVDRPIGAVTTKRGKALAFPFLTQYNGTADVQPIDQPVGTLSTHDRYGLAGAVVESPMPLICFPESWLPVFEVTADTPVDKAVAKWRHGRALLSLIRTMYAHNVGDIGFRMFSIDELKRAQGFPDAYKLYGTRTEKTKLIGNAVCPRVAKAICEAIGAA